MWRTTHGTMQQVLVNTCCVWGYHNMVGTRNLEPVHMYPYIYLFKYFLNLCLYDLQHYVYISYILYVYLYTVHSLQITRILSSLPNIHLRLHCLPFETWHFASYSNSIQFLPRKMDGWIEKRLRLGCLAQIASYPWYDTQMLNLCRNCKYDDIMSQTRSLLWPQVLSEETLYKNPPGDPKHPRNAPFIQENFLEILSDLRSVDYPSVN